MKWILLPLSLLLLLMLMPLVQAASTQHRALMALYQGDDTTARQLLREQGSLHGDWHYLQARLSSANRDWDQALSQFGLYLGLEHDSVHRIEARHYHGLIRRHRNEPELGEYLDLQRLLEQGQPQPFQRRSQAFLDRFPDSVLTPVLALQQALVQLEWHNQPEQAAERYLALIHRYPDSETALEAGLGYAICQLYLQQPVRARQQLTQTLQGLQRALPDDSLLHRVWQQRLDAALAVVSLTSAPATDDARVIWGAGARLNLDHPVGSGRDYRPLWYHLPKSQLPLQQLTLWISRHSDWSWLQPDLLKAASRAGYTPSIAFWYFGDEISPEFVEQHRQDYLDTLSNRLIPLLQQLPQAYLLLEPEFNKNGIEHWPGWPLLMQEVFTLIRQRAPQIQVALVLGDWDPVAQPPSPQLQQVLALGDFTAAMLMVSPHTELSHQSPDWSPWVRTLRLSQRLKQDHNKPFMLAYSALPSEPGWQHRQQVELKKLARILPALQQQNLFSINWFSAVDDPDQRGWFAESEPHFGLFTRELRPKSAATTLAAMTPRLRGDATVVRQQQTPQHLSLGFNRWLHWRLTTHRGQHLSGAGDRLHLSLPIAGLDGPATLTEYDGGQPLLTLTLPKGVAPLTHNSGPHRIGLNQWQQHHLPLRRRPEAKGVWLELTLTAPLDDGLFVGLVDSHGFERSVRLLGYADAGQRRFRAYVPLADLPYPWRKYQPGSGFLHHRRPVTRPQLMLSNRTAVPLSGTLINYGWY